MTAAGSVGWVELLLGVFVAYYAVLYGLYIVLIVLGARELRRYQRGVNSGEFQRLAGGTPPPPFSVIIPAFDEELLIVNTVLGALNLDYPQHEVIVANDGSRDRTLQVLIDRFQLSRADAQGHAYFPTQPVRGVYTSPHHPKLVVIDKVNGRKGDAVNTAINAARHPLLCIIDADCILEKDALLRVAGPFQRNPAVIAAGGVVRPANGLAVENGLIRHRRVPRRPLALMQAIEYLRSFQWARLGLSRLNSMLCISGAFLVVRTDVIVELGGLDPKAITEDFEFTLRLYRYIYERPGAERAEICYVPDAVCYTEVPESHGVYAAQRNRWQRATLQALLRYRRMAFNGRYGITGRFGVPFFFIFEGFAAIVEALSYLLIPLVIAAGLVLPLQVVGYLLLAALLGGLLSLSAVLLQETTSLRAECKADVAWLIAAGFVENLGYHQLHLLWRLVGTFEYFVRGRTDLGLMRRYGSYQK